MSPRSNPLPPRLGVVAWLTAVAAVAVPVRLAGLGGRIEHSLVERRDRLESRERNDRRVRRNQLPDVVALDTVGAVAATVALPPERQAAVRFDAGTVFSPEQQARWVDKHASEGEFARDLLPPTSVVAVAAPERIDVEWTAPANFAALQTRVAAQPLLRLGFRVYRWREGNEPKLLTTLASDRTTFLDRDLPLGRERFSYCVATVIEGTIGDLPTLIESKRSSVISVETVENFSLTVLETEADIVRLEIDAVLDGRSIERVFEVTVGAAIVPAVSAETPEPVARRLDTGLTLVGVRVVEGRTEEVRSRAEFLPDGRRQLDPVTGLPTFRTETVARPRRTLELTCRERSGAIRTFTSPAPN
ncbi:MAG: hypothetical protein FJ293_03535 [Planctomycetes bacterium]|nr:hypothetical protein [Planctomycetota bacterium]